MKIFLFIVFSVFLTACSAPVDVVYFHPNNSDLDSLMLKNPETRAKHHAFIAKISKEIPVLEAQGKACVITSEQLSEVPLSIDSLIKVQQFGMLYRKENVWELINGEGSLLQEKH